MRYGKSLPRRITLRGKLDITEISCAIDTALRHR